MSEPQPYAPVVPATSSTNTAGRISIVFAILAVVVGVGQQIFSSFAPLVAYNLQWGSGQLAALFAVVGAIHLLLSIVAVVFGAIGVTRRALGQSPVAAAIGLGVGAVGVLSGLIGFIVVPLLSQLV